MDHDPVAWEWHNVPAAISLSHLGVRRAGIDSMHLCLLSFFRLCDNTTVQLTNHVPYELYIQQKEPPHSLIHKFLGNKMLVLLGFAFLSTLYISPLVKQPGDLLLLLASVYRKVGNHLAGLAASELKLREKTFNCAAAPGDSVVFPFSAQCLLHNRTTCSCTVRMYTYDEKHTGHQNSILKCK